MACLPQQARAARVETPRPLLFGTTPVFLDEQAGFLNDWQDYLSEHMRHPVRFVQRASYREILTLLLSGKLDLAWLCGYPYVRNMRQLDLVAVPVYQHAPLYQSYLITPARDRTTRSILDLRGKVFAYSDPDSNSGWLTPQVELKRQGQNSGKFFKKSFYTFGHRRVVEAVAAGLAHGGAVDGYIWDTLARLHPELTGATRVAWRSQRFGFPPVAASAALKKHALLSMRGVLLNMRSDDAGQQLLKRLNLDGFTKGDSSLFDSIESNWRYLES